MIEQPPLTVMGMDATPTLYAHTWHTPAERSDLIQSPDYRGRRVALANYQYHPWGKRFLPDHTMNVLIGVGEVAFLQIGAIQLGHTFEEDLEGLLADSDARVQTYQAHQDRDRRGRKHPAWKASMRDIRAGLKTRLGAWNEQSYRAIQSVNHTVHTHQGVTRSWVVEFAAQQLAQHYTARIRPNDLASRLIEVHGTPEKVIMEALIHHLSVHEQPFFSEKVCRVNQEREFVSGAALAGRYQLRFDFGRPPVEQSQCPAFQALMAKAYWQIHLSQLKTV